jgi:enamine deaminase RidA (YjgF/YER057c/UK114 family)
LFELDGRPHLFISGTASIVGDATVHLGDVEAQTRETFANLQAVVDATNEALAAPRFVLDDLSFKAYIRRAADLPRVEHAVAELFGAHVQIRYVQADICRADLLVEIEAFGAAA